MKKFIIIIVLITPLMCSCLWVLMEKYGYGEYIVHNNSSHNVSFVVYYSAAIPILSAYDSLVPKHYLHNDTINIIANSLITRKYSHMGVSYHNELEIIFKRDFYKNNDYFCDVYYADTIKLYFEYIDSIAIMFDNSKKIVIENSLQSFIFSDFNEFWKEKGRSDEACHTKKGNSYCTFNYFITDEMYEQATPICR